LNYLITQPLKLFSAGCFHTAQLLSKMPQDARGLTLLSFPGFYRGGKKALKGILLFPLADNIEQLLAVIEKDYE